MGEITYAVLAFNGIAVRRFNEFPAKVWGRGVKWLDNATRNPITTKEAQKRFELGQEVLYTYKGYTAFVAFDTNGRTPTRTR